MDLLDKIIDKINEIDTEKLVMISVVIVGLTILAKQSQKD